MTIRNILYPGKKTVNPYIGRFAETKQKTENVVTYSLGDEKVLVASIDKSDKMTLKIDGAIKTLVAPCLDEAIKALPNKYRIVIHLYYYEGYSQKEIGKIINLTESAVATRLQRGRNLLKKMIGDDYFD